MKDVLARKVPCSPLPQKKKKKKKKREIENYDVIDKSERIQLISLLIIFLYVYLWVTWHLLRNNTIYFLGLERKLPNTGNLPNVKQSAHKNI